MMQPNEFVRPSPETRENNRPETIRESVSKEDMKAIAGESRLYTTCSASGPGGQNVNKKATCAEMRWRPEDSLVLNQKEKEKIIEWMLKNKSSQLVGNNEIYITCVANKSPEANKKTVMVMLHKYLTSAFTPKKKRIPTKPSRGAQERRIQDKKERGQTKALRGRVSIS
ncbi:MAG: peptide chain release factor-like protein [Patescibacteria group bacterium]